MGIIKLVLCVSPLLVIGYSMWRSEKRGKLAAAPARFGMEDLVARLHGDPSFLRVRETLQVQSEPSVRFDGEALCFADYPFECASVYPDGRLLPDAVAEVNLLPSPALRLKSGEMVFVPYACKSELLAFVYHHALPVVLRRQVWSELLSAFLPNKVEQFRVDEQNDYLAAHGLDVQAVTRWRREVSMGMCALREATVGRWRCYDLYDALSAQHAVCDQAAFADFYARAQALCQHDEILQDIPPPYPEQQKDSFGLPLKRPDPLRPLYMLDLSKPAPRPWGDWYVDHYMRKVVALHVAELQSASPMDPDLAAPSPDSWLRDVQSPYGNGDPKQVCLNDSQLQALRGWRDDQDDDCDDEEDETEESSDSPDAYDLDYCEFDYVVSAELEDAYRKGARSWHKFANIEKALALLDWADGYFSHPNEARWALQCHALVHEAGASDNAERSAQSACRIMAALGRPAEELARVRAMILALAPQGQATTPDEMLLRDVIHAPFGGDAAACTRYESALRKEAAGIPDAVYAAERAAMLKQLAESGVYHTPLFKAHFLERARVNIARQIARLTEPAQANA